MVSFPIFPNFNHVGIVTNIFGNKWSVSKALTSNIVIDFYDKTHIYTHPEQMWEHIESDTHSHVTDKTTKVTLNEKLKARKRDVHLAGGQSYGKRAGNQILDGMTFGPCNSLS